ncbi:peptidylprolyl isomerase [Sphingomonas pruni]|uniref:peptidylprolyl isomerase n=1 Tax=Sphingomonas pruni TaxID=40683 RepID=UPI000A05488C|nr:peptidylprolyl isomerase [Sphingomonas pruni]
MRRLIPMTLGLLATPVLAQTSPAPAPQPAPAPAVAPTPVPALPRVKIDTTAGSFTVEVETAKAPVTAANFLHYVDQKKLDGITFYRTCKVADKFGFVQFGTNGDPKRTLPPIKHEPTTITGLKHLNGTLSTARLAPGSARGDFTISVGDQPSFDADPTKPDDALKTNLGYAAFGRVVDGMDVVLKIFDAPIDPNATVRGSFKGEVPAAPVRVLGARRVK